MIQLGFQSTPPARGATTVKAGLIWSRVFQSTPPARGATESRHESDDISLFQSTPPARGATAISLLINQTIEISIHAPREGGDLLGIICQMIQLGFQSTPPARGATTVKAGLIWSRVFQSTPPARGATESRHESDDISLFQSTPPARGATAISLLINQTIEISIHAPREGGDP